MSHDAFDRKMTDLARLFDRDPNGFLSAFSPIHVTWHSRPGVVQGGALQRIGFLTFHHSAIRAYRLVLRSAGQRLPAPWGPGYDTAIDAITSPTQFSREIEDWHNGIHNSDMTLMNPATNIFRPRYWALHNFIDRRFTKWERNHRKLTSAEHHTV